MGRKLQILLVDLSLPGALQPAKLSQHTKLYACQLFFLQLFVKLLFERTVQKGKAQADRHFFFHTGTSIKSCATYFSGIPYECQYTNGKKSPGRSS